MSRALRRFDPGTPIHVVVKGNNGGWIVRDADDRRLFRWRLDRVATLHEWELAAWCLMTNHAHFVLRASAAALSRGMQELVGGHARTINARYGRQGHLFRNRFFAVEIETDRHHVASIVYVNRNPVRHRACDDAAEWRDSSFRATMGLEPAPDWLAVGRVLRLFGQSDESARRVLEWHVSSGRVPVSDTLAEVQRFELADAERPAVRSG